MKLMRLAAVVAAFAVVGGTVMAEDADVRALQAKLAAQEARLNDLQAKMYGTACEEPELVAQGLTSIRKNAVVTIGGTVNTRQHSRHSELESSINGSRRYTGFEWVADGVARPANPTFPTFANPGNTPAGTAVGGRWQPTSEIENWGNLNGANPYRAAKRTISKSNRNEFVVADANVEIKVDVNEYFDAFIKFNLNENNRSLGSGMAENAWIRWKNICNSGFGLLVGRDRERHGGIAGVGLYDNWQVGREDSASGAFAGWGSLGAPAMAGEGMFIGTSVLPTHSTHGNGRVVQINPYWETQDGKFKAELSLFQGQEYNTAGADYTDENDIDRKRDINFGAGSMAFRLTWQPVDGLKLVGSVKNLYADNHDGAGYWSLSDGIPWTNVTNGANPALINYNGDAIRFSSTNTSVFGGFEYNPTFFNRATIWASYMHGWNEAWVKNQNSDSVSFGLRMKLTDQFTAFAEGDWLRVKNEQGTTWHKGEGWASNVGLQYALPYGVDMMVGWRHEVMKYNDRRGVEHTKYTANTVYGHLGFNF